MEPNEIEQGEETAIGKVTMKTGYVNGSNMLVSVGGKATGHATSHRVSISAETKDRAVKPAATDKTTRGLFKKKGVVGLSVSITAEGLCFYEETENGYRQIAGLMFKGKSVPVECFERESDEKPYLKGNFVITYLDRDDPANDDSTYSATLENDGDVEFDETGLTLNASIQTKE